MRKIAASIYVVPNFQSESIPLLLLTHDAPLACLKSHGMLEAESIWSHVIVIAHARNQVPFEIELLPFLGCD